MRSRANNGEKAVLWSPAPNVYLRCNQGFISKHNNFATKQLQLPPIVVLLIPLKAANNNGQPPHLIARHKK